jgi:hypothetical protein
MFRSAKIERMLGRARLIRGPKVRGGRARTLIVGDGYPGGQLRRGTDRQFHYTGARETRKAGFVKNPAFRAMKSGGYLLSHAVTHAVPSAQEGLTSVFGMGTGVTPPIRPPESYTGVNVPVVSTGGLAHARAL